MLRPRFDMKLEVSVERCSDSYKYQAWVRNREEWRLPMVWGDGSTPEVAIANLIEGVAQALEEA